MDNNSQDIKNNVLDSECYSLSIVSTNRDERYYLVDIFYDVITEIIIKD